jgi:hypothetical protein
MQAWFVGERRKVDEGESGRGRGTSRLGVLFDYQNVRNAIRLEK